MSHEELIDVIDERNLIIDRATKREVYQKQLSHRVVHVMVVSEDKIFIPRRSLSVDYMPGHYCSSAGGHVQSGETSEIAALRELKEEIGLEGPIELLNNFFFIHEFKVHGSIYLKRFDPMIDIISLDPIEVGSGCFYNLEEIKKLDQNKFHPQLEMCLKELQK